MDISFLFVQALNGLASASSLFIIAVGLTIVFGVTRIVNFAHGSFYMLGAYLGKTKLDGNKGVMVDYVYLDGAKYLPSDEEVKKMRAID